MKPGCIRKRISLKLLQALTVQDEELTELRNAQKHSASVKRSALDGEKAFSIGGGFYMNPERETLMIISAREGSR